MANHGQNLMVFEMVEPIIDMQTLKDPQKVGQRELVVFLRRTGCWKKRSVCSLLDFHNLVHVSQVDLYQISDWHR